MKFCHSTILFASKNMPKKIASKNMPNRCVVQALSSRACFLASRPVNNFDCEKVHEDEIFERQDVQFHVFLRRIKRLRIHKIHNHEMHLKPLFQSSQKLVRSSLLVLASN